MGSSRVQAGDLGKALASALTVGKPFKAYKPYQVATTRKALLMVSALVSNLSRCVSQQHAGRRVGKTLARASTVGKPFKAYKPHHLDASWGSFRGREHIKAQTTRTTLTR